MSQRTSTFIHFSKLSDSRIALIENRAAELMCLPNHSIEPLQLVRHEKGQYFRDHHDLGVLYEDGSVVPNINPLKILYSIHSIVDFNSHHMNIHIIYAGGATYEDSFIPT